MAKATNCSAECPRISAFLEPRARARLFDGGVRRERVSICFLVKLGGMERKGVK